MAKKGVNITIRNFRELDAILASSFRKRDAGKVLYRSLNDGARIVRKSVRQKTPVSKGEKTAGGGRQVQPNGTLRRSVKNGLRRKGYGKDPNLFAAAVFTKNDKNAYSKDDGWYAHFIEFGTKHGIEANPFMDKGFSESAKKAEMKIKLSIWKRTKDLQRQINMLK